MPAPNEQTSSLTARAKKWVAGLFDKGFDPATIKLPQVNRETGESNIKGLYIIGEVGGTPLIKLGLNAGHDVIERLFANEKPRAKLNVENELDEPTHQRLQQHIADCPACLEYVESYRQVTLLAGARGCPCQKMSPELERKLWDFIEANPQLR